VEAGLTLMAKAQEFANNEFARARGIRNGLMIAVLAFCPIRVKNFAELEIGGTFQKVQGRWWIALPASTTKPRERRDERPVPEVLNSSIDIYLNQCRPILVGARSDSNALWISSRTGKAWTVKNLGTLVSRLTRETLGVDVSPHLFRAAASTTAATYGSRFPHLASALLNHTDPRVTEEHYNRATSISAANAYAEITQGFLRELNEPG